MNRMRNEREQQERVFTTCSLDPYLIRSGFEGFGFEGVES